MQYNDKFTMKDFFQNKELKNIFPQFTKKDSQKNVFSYEWVEKKVSDYLKRVFNGRKSGEDIIIKGKHKERLKQIKAMKTLIEDMFNNISVITKNIRYNTRLFTPFQSIEQLKEIDDPLKKIAVMEVIFDNLNYNPECLSFNRFRSDIMPNNFYRRQQIWFQKVGYDRRRNYGKN